LYTKDMNSKDLKETYNIIAKDWTRDHKDDTWFFEGTNAFLSMLKPGVKILDVGCGSGLKSKMIKDRGFQVDAFDFSEEMITIAKESYPDINFSVFDIYDLDKWQGAYDAIFAQAVLLHIPKKDIEKILNLMILKLNKNGLLYVAVKEVKDDAVEEKIIKESDYGYEYERFFSYYSVEEIKNLLEKAGMEVTYFHEKEPLSKWIQIISRKI